MRSAESSSQDGENVTNMNQWSPEQAKQALQALEPNQVNEALSKLYSASVGDIVAVFSRSSVHKHFFLADIEWIVLPPLRAGQFYVVQAAHKDGFREPVAVATWALVSDEIDQRLQQAAGRHLRLRPDEWISGEIGWLIDLVGGPAEVRSALEWLASGPFKERPLKLVVRDQRGVARIGTLHQILSERLGDGALQTTGVSSAAAPQESSAK